jgi:hypothetical protein
VPIYVEYTGNETLVRVVAKYMGVGMSDWKIVELQKVGDGWGGLVPCADVTQGKLQYYLQGFNAENDPVATSGNRNNAYSVPIKPTIEGPEPTLPGKDPPKQCSELAGAECPPNFPGCKQGKAAGEDCEKNADCGSNACVGGKCEDKKGTDEDCEKDDECASGTCKDGKCEGGAAAPTVYNKMWVGVGLSLDMLLVPGPVNDVCALNSTGTGTLTAGNPYTCYDPSANAGFPGSGTAGGAVNATIDKGSPNRLDWVQSGGFARGPLTIFASFDYALSPNVLLGARAGYEALTYPGSNPAPAFAPVRIEARLTYLIGTNAINQSFAPVLFAGAGAGEFDAMVPVKVTLLTAQTPLQENAWLTAGPVYATAGGGVRLAFGGEKKNIALTGLVKLETAFGGTSGFLFGIAPEAGIQYGF